MRSAIRFCLTISTKVPPSPYSVAEREAKSFGFKIWITSELINALRDHNHVLALIFGVFLKLLADTFACESKHRD
jgi:hypothetical protein